ncbi:MAG: hypothetical protein A2275_11225 [Bacteroidetes bacterium RIFOXYA12_FULL_35_11]|nr:MAG: hypothetical protein A2X01_19170 [Bacteroidetes bacterium GWF2_35_48]OFY74412.1 MAG: hypothetical protein A2275_11225 [Bacteroidetes bacterium RIFOXYA12_FULL_35_11]OFY93580.1 MAG: hypothetical protein A2491_00840 [Bacteroidetes bacterium RIFOXYC12_FULL_35_7]HBX50712.1 hypothetical protein [Bacteroidales bacterium]
MGEKSKKFLSEQGYHTLQKPQLSQLLCLKCSAPLPLTKEGNTIKCHACSHINPLPEEYIILRDSKNLHRKNIETAENLYKKISSPPGLLLRVWYNISVAVTSTLGIIMAILLWISGIFLFVFLFIVYMIYYLIAPSIGVNLIDVYGSGVTYSLTFVALSIIFIFPMILNSYVSDFVELRKTLHASLSAIWPDKGTKQALCRGCGAPVEVKKDETYSLCFYCDTQNLVSLPDTWLRSVSGFAKWHFQTIEEAAKTEKSYRKGLRKNIKNWFIGTIIAGLIFWCVGSFISWVDNDSMSIPSWSDLNKNSRIVCSASPGGIIDKEIPVGQFVQEKVFAPIYWIALNQNETISLKTKNLDNVADLYVFNTTNIESTRIFKKMECTTSTDSIQNFVFTAPYKGIFGINTLTYGQVAKPFEIEFKIK